MDWKNGSLYFLWLVLSLASINGYAEKKVVCYYTNWSIYRPGTAKFSPENINPYLCTHLIYAFGGFTKDNTLKPFDKYQDIEKGGYAKFTGLKTYNKKLKTMLAIGGWNEGSTRFSPMVADPERRHSLVKNAVKFLRQNHFDGLDLDWEYPAFRDGGKPRDKNNYADLVQELRQEFERESSKTGRPRLLLSMAIPAGIEYLEKGYDLARLNEYLDFFNLLSYDYHSAFEPAVNHHSPLYGLEEDNEYNYDNELTVDFTMSYLLKHHVSPDKLILGIPTYGRSYTLYNQDATAIGSPTDGPGEEGDATREKGYLAYYEICENVKSNQWEVVQPNPKAMGPYAFKGNQWVGYDDEDIVKMKSLYVIEKNLGGIMFWAIDNDDFRGNCHGRPYPLIEAAKEALLAAIENEQTTQKPKSGLRKKTRPQLSSQRSNDSSNRRTRPEKQRPTTTQAPRKRVSQRVESNARNRGNSEEKEDEGNAVKETNSRWKSNQRNRASKGTNRRKIQTTTERYEEPIEEEARESTSSRLTTPEPPTTPDPGSDFKCEDEGFFSHPRDCKKYFWCLDSGPGGLGIVAHQFTCPSGLVFNKAADSCDYSRNVICPKVKAKAATTTPKAPITTTSRPTTTTRRTTTTEETNSAEEYEYEEDENTTDEEIKEEIKSTTSRPLIYKTISRNKPTTTEATEAPTTSLPKIFKPNSAKVFDLEDEEDPRVIKELIELIRKAGGLEQLERQLNIQEKSPMRKSDPGDDSQVTPATISRSLYERVLSRQGNKVNNLFGSANLRTTTEESKNSRSGTQNGPGGAQFEGLDEVPEVKSLRRTKKPQYVTIERQRPSTTPVSDDEFEEDELADESSQQDNADVASFEDQTVSDLPESRKDSAKKVTPNYVNIRRTRPTTPAYENDLEAREETKEKELKFSQDNLDKSENESFSRQKPVISTANDETEKETVIPKNRYTNTQRFRSTTLRTDESTAFTESIKPSEKTTTEIVNPTTPAINQEEREVISETLAFSTLPVSTIEFSSTPIAETSKQPAPATEVASGPKATISTTHLPLAESTAALLENLVTEIPTTTQPTTRATQPSTSRTTAVSQPRPFGFPRRGRPTTTTTPTPTVTSTTEQSRVKIAPAQDLPTLKNLINHELQSQSVDHIYDDEVINSASFETESDHFQGIPVPVRILSDEDSQELADQLAVLHLPQSILNSLVSHSNILRIQVVNQLQEDDSNEIEKDKPTTAFAEPTVVTTEKSTTIQENPSTLRGFFITKSLNVSQSTTQSSDSLESSTVQSNTQSTDFLESTTEPSNSSNYSSELSLSTLSTSDFSETTLEIDFSSTTISPLDVTDNDTTSEIIKTTVAINEVTTLPPTTEFETVSPESVAKPIKQIIVIRRQLDESTADSSREDRKLNDSRERRITPVPDASSHNNWRKRVIRKRPRSLLLEDQSPSESEFQDTVVKSQLVVSLMDADDKLNKTGNLFAVGEVNPVRSSSNFLRKPGTRLEVQNRLKISRNKTQDGTNSERRYSSKIKSDYDQSGRAQELAVSVADPPAETSPPRLGSEKIASSLRGIRGSADEVATEPSVFTTSRTTPARRRQKPNGERPLETTTTHRPRQPAIIDYDYYVDEEVRLSIGPELQDKIYVTDRGTIGCLDQGTFAHPTSCKKFITCAKMVGGQVIATEYTCPKKLSFDPVGGICNWSAGLGCNESA